jgi:hypothetical protein
MLTNFVFPELIVDNRPGIDSERCSDIVGTKLFYECQLVRGQHEVVTIFGLSLGPVIHIPKFRVIVISWELNHIAKFGPLAVVSLVVGGAWPPVSVLVGGLGSSLVLVG